MTAPTLATILAGLPPDHAEVVRRHLAAPAWQIRADALAERDAAIREARSVLALVGRPTCAATELSLALARYAASGWLREQTLPKLPDEADPCRRALHRVLRLSEGKVLGWRRIHDVLQGGSECETNG